MGAHELTFLQGADKPGQPGAAILTLVAARPGRDEPESPPEPGVRNEERTMAFPWKKMLAGGAAAVVILGGAAALTGFAGGCGGHGHRGHGRDPAAMAAFATARVDDALDDVEATPEQRTRIHAVKDRLLASAQAAREGHTDDHALMLEAWRSPSPDAAALHARVDARLDAMRALAHQAVDGALEVHATLTPEQRDELARKVERRMSR
jgi:Spy/CpxP family protein refolding chaperone